MSVNVSAPVLWNSIGNFLNNSLIGIDRDAIVVGYVLKPTAPGDPTPIQTLQLKDNRSGITLYTTWTREAWQQAVGLTSTSPNTANGGEGIPSEIYTGSGSVTVGDAIELFYYNPPSAVATATITLPAHPIDHQVTQIYFGGTISGKDTVVTLLTIAVSAGQVLAGDNAYATVIAGSVITARFSASSLTWYVSR